jgi:hypothetical protein
MSEQRGTVIRTSVARDVPTSLPSLVRQARSEGYTVGNFRFDADFSRDEVEVSFAVSAADVNADGFLSALQTFVAALPVIEIRERLESLADYVGVGGSEDVLNEDEEYLRRVLRWHQEAIANDFGIEVSAGVKTMMTLIDIELRRRSASKQTRVTVVNRPSRRTRRSAGFVYLLQSPTGYYKIGLTGDPDNRAKTFGIQLPFEVEFLALIPTEDMRVLEQELHRRFAEKRVNGEWFSLDDGDVEYIKGLAS